jgi:hypothetical protein
VFRFLGNIVIGAPITIFLHRRGYHFVLLGYKQKKLYGQETKAMHTYDAETPLKPFTLKDIEKKSK